MPRKKSPPSYRLHKARNCAVVTIDGQNHYLGAYGSPDSHVTPDSHATPDSHCTPDSQGGPEASGTADRSITMATKLDCMESPMYRKVPPANTMPEPSPIAETSCPI